MSFLAPLALMGLALVGLAWLAHRLGEEVVPPIPVSILRFVGPQETPVVQRRRVRDPLLLALRAAIVALLVLFVAQPTCVREGELRTLAQPHDAVLLLDRSASMSLRSSSSEDAPTLLDAQAQLAMELVEALPAGSTLAWLELDPQGILQPAVAVDGATAASLAAQLQRPARPLGPEAGGEIGSGLQRASELLEREDASPDRARAIYVLSDRQVGGLASLPPSWPEPLIPTPIPAAKDAESDAPLAADDLELVGIEEWELGSAADGGLRVRARLTREGGAPATERQVVVALYEGDSELAQSGVELGPNASEDVVFSLERPERARPLELRLLNHTGGHSGGHDPWPHDDRRFLWLEARPKKRVLLVDGDPTQQRQADELFFLSAALRASISLEDDPLAIDLEVVTAQAFEEGFDPSRLEDVDLLVLANLAAPSSALGSAIESRVESGMGLWVNLGSRVETAPYNEALGGLLPLPLREAIYAGSAPGQRDGSVQLEAALTTHPLFSAPSLKGQSLELEGTRARRIFLLDPDPSRDPAIALRYDSGAPALLTRALGEGRVAMWTSSIDRDWNEFPLQPDFVPLSRALVEWLVPETQASAHRDTHVGETPPELRSLLEAPPEKGGAASTLRLQRLGQAAIEIRPEQLKLDTLPLDAPGHYQVLGSQDEVRARFSLNVEAAERPDRERIFASSGNPDPEASLDTQGAAEGLEAPKLQLPRWPYLIPLILLLWLGESILRERRR